MFVGTYYYAVERRLCAQRNAHSNLCIDSSLIVYHEIRNIYSFTFEKLVLNYILAGSGRSDATRNRNKKNKKKNAWHKFWPIAGVIQEEQEIQEITEIDSWTRWK